MAASKIITHLLSRIPHKKIAREKVKLPKRHKPHGYRDPGLPVQAHTRDILTTGGGRT
jgi:hypothetical protein